MFLHYIVLVTSYLDHACEKITFLAWDIDLANPNTYFFDTAFQQFRNVDSLCIIQRTAAVTAGLSYWEVGLDWPFKTPPGEKATLQAPPSVRLVIL
jgi:hypothetical protein